MRISVIAMVVVGLVGRVASAQPAPDKAAAQAANPLNLVNVKQDYVGAPKISVIRNGGVVSS